MSALTRACVRARACAWCKYWCQSWRAHRSLAPRRESYYARCPKHKSPPVGLITTTSYLASLCLLFFLDSRHHWETSAVRVYVSLASSTAVAPCTSLSSDNFMPLIASQPSRLAACAVQAYWAEETQFGST